MPSNLRLLYLDILLFRMFLYASIIQLIFATCYHNCVVKWFILYFISATVVSHYTRNKKNKTPGLLWVSYLKSKQCSVTLGVLWYVPWDNACNESLQYTMTLCHDIVIRARCPCPSYHCCGSPAYCSFTLYVMPLSHFHRYCSSVSC